jgi:5-oxoprolinase (ATP-hydrolysing) subunit A
LNTIDLNCDMGESFCPWKLGDDQALMPWISSANVACGAHAGDPDVMRATVRLANEHGVAVGAHPGYPDLPGFGRRPFAMTHEEVVNMMLYQIGALWGVAKSEGIVVRHVKPHGALYNRACEDASLAASIVEAVWTFSPSLVLVGLPGSELEAEARRAGLPFSREGFADRVYEPSGLLRDRRHTDALISDPARAATQAVRLAQGQVLAHNGALLDLQVDTICVHGDTPGAPAIARAVREALEQQGLTVAARGADLSTS